MSKGFLDAARHGRNHWWLYLQAILAIGLFWWYFSGFVGLGQEIIFSTLLNSDDIAFFIGSLTIWIPLLLILALAVRVLHHRRFRTLISFDGSFQTKRLLVGFGVWLGLLIIFTGIDYFLHPQDYANTFNLSAWFLLLPFALILTPIQTSTEELFYRGYLMQGLGLLTKHPLVLILVTSLAFTIPHLGNPEMGRGEFVWGALVYLTWGAFFAAITLKDDRLELALGVHAANNLFSDLIVNTVDSVVPTPSMWTHITAIPLEFGLLFLLIYCGLFYFFVFSVPEIWKSRNRLE